MERRTLDNNKLDAQVNHKETTARGRGREIKAQPVNKAKESSNDSDEEIIQPPFRKKGAFGPYHHYRGSQFDQDKEVREQLAKE